MRILALDASGARCSAGLLDGARCVGERFGADSRGAAAALPRMVQDLLAGSRLDAVAVTTGPGSFTGLRSALALAHGLAFGAGVPVVGVTVAEALLHGISPGSAVWVALDARRPGRVFLDTGDGMVTCQLDALPPPGQPVLVLGDGAQAVVDAFGAASVAVTLGGKRSVAVADVARVAWRRLAGEIAPCAPQPLYVEPPAAEMAP